MAPERPKLDELDPNDRRGRETVILGNLPQLIPCYITRLRRRAPTAGDDMACFSPASSPSLYDSAPIAW
jgi:hypothetical protein